MKLTKNELEGALSQFGAFNSAHEGFAVILEEMDELKAEVWKNHRIRDKAKLQHEATQVAAMAIRFLVDIC